MDAIYPSLLATINNIAPYLEQLGPQASFKLHQLFASMSSPSFLLANETNYSLLQSLLESMNAIIEHQYSSKSTLRGTRQELIQFKTIRSSFKVFSSQEDGSKHCAPSPWKVANWRSSVSSNAAKKQQKPRIHQPVLHGHPGTAPSIASEVH